MFVARVLCCFRCLPLYPRGIFNMPRKKKPSAKDYEQIITLQDQLIKANAQELEQAYKDRNEAIRRYNALHQLGQMAKDCGVDLSAKLPEHEKNKWKDFKFNIDARVLESGKTTFTATAKKKVSQEQQDFPTLHKKNKKKK